MHCSVAWRRFLRFVLFHESKLRLKVGVRQLLGVGLLRQAVNTTSGHRHLLMSECRVYLVAFVVDRADAPKPNRSQISPTFAAEHGGAHTGIHTIQ